MRKAEIKDGVVINAIEVDGDNVPDWCKNWPDLVEGNIGWLYDGHTFSPPPVDLNALADRIRDRRDQLLTDSDWTQLPDAPVDQAAWATYRQALRDIPQQAGFPADITWPTKPE